MIKPLVFLFLLLSQHVAFTQSRHCADANSNLKKIYRVTAKSGVILREGPNQSSAKISAVPYGEEVFGCASSGQQETIEGISGTWISVSYGAYEGYLFDGFLEPSSNNDIGFFIPGVGRNPDPYDDKREFWGLVLAGSRAEKIYNRDCLKHGDCQLVKLQIAWRETVVEGNTVKGWFPVNASSPIFVVFYGFKPSQRTTAQFFDDFVAPGESISLQNYDDAGKKMRNYTVFATGNPIQGALDDYRMFSGIDNYNLRIREFQLLQGYGPAAFVLEQSILKEDIKCHREGYYQAKSLFMTGDFDGDGKLDFIFKERWESGACLSFHLFLSSKADKGYLVKEVAEWGVCGC